MMTESAEKRNSPESGVLARVHQGSDSLRRLLLYGPEGIGKSTWASGADAPLFLCPEDGLGPGLNHVDRIDLKSWNEILRICAELCQESHEFRTVVIDTLDWLEGLIHAHLCERDRKTDIEDYGYGKGYVIAAHEMSSLLRTLDILRRQKKMDIIFLAHSHIRTFTPPDGDSYDRYELKGHKALMGKVKEWCDAVLFAKYEVFVNKDRGASKGKGFGGARKIYTTWNPAWDAKSRYSLPESLPLSWDDFNTAMQQGIDASSAQIDELAQYISTHIQTAEFSTDESREKAVAWLGGDLSVEALSKQPITILKTAADRIAALQSNDGGQDNEQA